MKDFLDLLESVAVITASVFAIYGIDSWRRETKWKRKYELAEEVLFLFYQAEESIKKIRHPFSNSTEGQSRIKGPNETPEQTEILNRAHVVYERYDKEKDIFNELKKLKHRFKVNFGNDSTEPFEEIEKVLQEIFWATYQLARVYWPRQRKPMTDDKFKEHLSKMEEFESIFWSGASNPDPIDQRVKKAIEKLEYIYRNKI